VKNKQVSFLVVSLRNELNEMHLPFWLDTQLYSKSKLELKSNYSKMLPDNFKFIPDFPITSFKKISILSSKI